MIVVQQIGANDIKENVSDTEAIAIGENISDIEIKVNIFDNVKGGKYHKVESVGMVFNLQEVSDLIDICAKAELHYADKYIGELKEKLISSIADYQ